MLERFSLGAYGAFLIECAAKPSPEYTQELGALLQSERCRLRCAELDDTQYRLAVLQAFCKTTLVGWEGIKNQYGTEIPFSADNAIALFTDLPALFDEVHAFYAEMCRARLTIAEQSAKNLTEVLLYQLEQGDKEEFLIAQAKKARAPIPERILNRPELLPGLEFIFNAFNDLCSERQMSMALGPIPWSVIDQYARRYNLDSESYEVFKYLIRQMDITFIKFYNDKKPVSSGKPTPNTRGR